MKKLLAIIIIVSIVLFAFQNTPVIAAPATYYVSANSTNSTGTQLAPFKTIGEALRVIKPGDTIEILEGTYNEKIVSVGFKGDPSKPLTIKGAKNANVNISSYDPINSSWSLYKDNIYKTNIGIKDDVSHALILNNNKFENLVEARWPNADPKDMLKMDRAIMKSGSNSSMIYDNNLPVGDFNGATAYLWTGYVTEQYLSYARTITDYSAGKSFKLDKPVGDGSITYTPRDGDWYYLTNSLWALDNPGEYYYDKATGDFYIIMPDQKAPSTSQVTIKTRTTSAELWDSSFVHLENLNLFGGITIQGSRNCVLDKVNTYYSDFFRTNDGYNTHINSYNSSRLVGHNNTWKNSEIAYTMSSGILINGNNNAVLNCNIHDVNIGGGYNANITVETDSKDTYIGHNDLHNSGRFLIYFLYNGQQGNGYGTNTIIEYNDCYNSMQLTNDGGAIYAYHRNGTGVTIRNNWVHDSPRYSYGIYLDNGCTDFTVYRNVVWNIGEAGICLNTDSLNNKIINNTVFNCNVGVQSWPATGSQKNTQVQNNAIEPPTTFVTNANAPTQITNDFTGEFNLDDSHVPNINSKLIDKGSIVTSISDVYSGNAPDIGAYERLGVYWTPGKLNINTNFGDAYADGNINAKDILTTRKYLANINTPIYLTAADSNADFEINAKDILLLRKFIANYSLTLGPLD